MTAVHMSQKEFAALGLSGASNDAPAPASADLREQPARPAIQPLMLPLAGTPHSQVYQVVAALLALSEAIYGGAVVKHDAIARSWDIRVGQTTAYRVQVEPLATVITTYTRADRWQAGEQKRYSALALHEQFQLFYRGSR